MTAQRIRCDGARGLASLELVLALPLLLMLLAVVFFLGDGMIKANQTVVAARADAWSQRGSRPSADPFAFTRSSTERSLVNGAAEETIRSNAAIGLLSEATAEHTVMSGAWDYRDIDLNRPPSYAVYAKVASSGVVSTASMANQLLSNGLQGLLQQAFASVADSVGVRQGKIDEGRRGASQVKTAGQAEIKKEQDKVTQLETQTIPQLEEKIGRANAAINTSINDDPDLRRRVDRLKELHSLLKNGDRAPLFKDHLVKERDQHIQKLKDVDERLPQQVESLADDEFLLAHYRDELNRRRAALQKSREHSQKTDKWLE